MIKNEFLILHKDIPFPLDTEFRLFFMPSFWLAPDSSSSNTDAQNYYEEEGTWNYFELEPKDEDGGTIATFRVDSVRERNYPASFMFSELPIDEFVHNFKSGSLSNLPGVRDWKSWAFTSLSLETEDPRDKKEFTATVERFLAHTEGIVVYPELMTGDDFRKFFSLTIDKVEEEKEPEEQE